MLTFQKFQDAKMFVSKQHHCFFSIYSSKPFEKQTFRFYDVAARLKYYVVFAMKCQPTLELIQISFCYLMKPLEKKSNAFNEFKIGNIMCYTNTMEFIFLVQSFFVKFCFNDFLAFKALRTFFKAWQEHTKNSKISSIFIRWNTFFGSFSVSDT